ncbi:putative phosphatidate phosphatase isoform X1 [Coccinella septempunctata]|uniref:putative phosphatidate phosphatase isoform X1 n=1 Tax=Coccinella septempunctata TaxID=41139 RepID=UPI001D06FD10|nr:putative phosphatidate phosphatase isoform X1 [Coccinella septempunctata]
MASVNSVEVPATKVVLDVVLLLCVGFPVLFLYLWGTAYQRGFFCDDESLRHPYYPSTVPSAYLYIVGIGMNCTVMILTEYFNCPKTNKEVRFLGKIIPNWLVNTYCVLGIFAFGMACSHLMTDIMKYTVGRLRPHFYTVCQPSIDCTSDFLNHNHTYHTVFTCTNELYRHNKHIMKELRLSFPSGHSSFSMFTMTYFAIYLHKRMTWDGSKLLRHTLQYLAVLAAIFTGMTRISDYKHHWSDVLAGLSLGCAVAVITATCFSTLFPKRNGKSMLENDSSELSNLNGNRAAAGV